MIEDNRDVFPPADTVALYEPIKPIVVNDIVDAAFTKRENAAIKAKKSYHWLGRWAIGLIAISTIYSVANALIFDDYPGSAIVGLIVAFGAVFGIAMQIYIVVKKIKRTWLLNRFGAERLRAIKFQGYQVATQAKDKDELQTLADTFYRGAVTKLDGELNAGFAAIAEFSPHDCMDGNTPISNPINPDLSDVARDSYFELRIKYQSRFAGGERHNIGVLRRWANTSSDLIYLLGACLIFVALLFKSTDVWLSDSWIAWAEFLAISAFVIGISRTILENNSLTEQSDTRFQRYGRELKATEDEVSTPDTPLNTVVEKIERVVLDELDEFCREADKISYRL